MVSCKYFWLLLSALLRFWAVPGTNHTALGKNFENMLHGCVYSAFYLSLRSHLGGRVEKLRSNAQS